MSLKKLSVRTRAAEMYAVQIIIVLFSVMVKGITRIFPVNLPVSCVLLGWHGVRCASSLCLENWLLGLRAHSQNAAGFPPQKLQKGRLAAAWSKGGAA